MSDHSEEDKVGYGRPPKKTRWQKGQSGNPKRRYSARSRSAVEWIYQLILKPVEITLNGETRKVPTLEAIVTLVSLKALSGDQRALALQLKYKAFGAQNSERKVEIVFIDNDYTRALAAEALTAKTDDE